MRGAGLVATLIGLVRKGRLCIMLAATLLLCSSGDAAAVTIDDVDLLLFPPGGENTGFTNRPLDSDFWTSDFDVVLCAGAGDFVPQTQGSCAEKTAYDLKVEQNLMTVHQNPQATGGVPTASDSFIADSEWIVTYNPEAEVRLGQTLFLFTNVDLSPSSLFPGGYPDLQVGLDGNLLQIAKHGYDFYFGAIDLGPLKPGDSTSFIVRYVVLEEMPIVNNDIVMPPLASLGLGLTVPEPSTVLLLACGLSGLVFLTRSRP